MIEVIFLHPDFQRVSFFLPNCPDKSTIIAGALMSTRMSPVDREKIRAVFETHYPIVKIVLGIGIQVPVYFVHLGKGFTPE